MGMSPLPDDLSTGLLSGFNSEVPESRIREIFNKNKESNLQEIIEERFDVRDEKRSLRERTESQSSRISLKENERKAMIDILSQNERFEDIEFDGLSDEDLISLVALSGKISKKESKRKISPRQSIHEELDDYILGDLWSETVQEVNLKTQGKLLKFFKEKDLEDLYMSLLEDYENKIYFMDEHEVKKIFRSELIGLLSD